MTTLSRIPVCAACLAQPEPFDTEFFCISCRTAFVNPYPLAKDGRCALCRLGTRGFDVAYCFGAYEGTLSRLIQLMKFEGMRPLARPLGEFLWRALPLSTEADAVVPMPLHWKRRYQRGFNQAELLAREVARRRRIPVWNAVRRMRNTPSQTELTSAQRRKNMEGAFCLTRRADVEGKKILLVDDVMTTGASASACASIIKRGGARSVTVLTVARADRRLTDFTAGTASGVA
ncbi:MAG: ComF family protein [Bryobacteraceae bacterium]